MQYLHDQISLFHYQECLDRLGCEDPAWREIVAKGLEKLADPIWLGVADQVMRAGLDTWLLYRQIVLPPDDPRSTARFLVSGFKH